MPVSTGLLGEPRAKRCKLCDESSHRSESGSGYWQLQLDRDLVDTISAIYPEWFKNNMAEGGLPVPTRESPPKAVVDSSPLHIDQNKESLKVKLMLRRPLDQLVAQGIMPPHKTPAVYHGQRRQLERAKTGDMLKAKIQQRPSRQELERRHILESDPGNVDPSIAERQRMLKKARLADQLNDQLSHRPGPLELIRKNILHIEEPLEQAVKTGRIPYKATCEGQLNRPQHPSSYITPEEDSQSSEGDNIVSPGPSDVLETAAKSAGIVVSLIPATDGTVVLTSATPVLHKDELVFADFSRTVPTPLFSRTSATSPASLTSSASSLSPLSSVASPVPSIVSQPATPIPPPLPQICLTPRPLPISLKSDAPGKDKNRKKSKSKSSPKTRTIKFHEYKGPPSALKSPALLNGESSYDLLLQQQNLLLQLQLQHKFPQIILPASQENSQQESNNNINNNNHLNIQQPSPSPSTSSESSAPIRLSEKRLDELKVNELKFELKKRNLPVSGSKPQLMERLRVYWSGQSDMGSQGIPSVESLHNSNLDQSVNSPQYQDNESPQNSIKDEPSDQMDVTEPLSPIPQQQMFKQEPLFQQTLNEIAAKNHEDIMKAQQRQIEELQKELTRYQLKLQAATRAEPKAQVIALQKHLQAKQQQQQATLQLQQLQALQAQQVNEEQQKLQQQHVAFQNQKNLTKGLVFNTLDATLVFNQLIQGKVKLANGHQRANSLPNFFNSIVTPIITTPVETKAEPVEIKPPPPLYEEATKHINKKNNVKSQIVDDVLEILIKNGELPPSAAQDPSTPGSAGTKAVEPVFPNHNQNMMDPSSPEASLELDPNELLDSLDNLDNMDLSQFVMDLGGCGHHNGDNNNIENEHHISSMDTDDWLESLLPNNGHDNGNIMSSAPLAVQEPDLTGYDPLLAISHGHFDPFTLDEFRSPADLTASLSWDKLDYTA